uniref:NADH-ubiquinone oxidoreductase chain 2 n=1 Tax=Mordellidae sp. GENSP01 TaxID=1205565 RepID=A0A0S2MS06_9CUCU|nr:NADH deshydrogenase subunit 2 [Mordellidae sp. GENSP01]
MMKLYKILFFNSLIMGTVIAISSYSWLSMWMGLEINLLSFIPIMSSTKNIYSTESSIKYFLTQALASLILMFSIIILLIKNEFIAPTMNSLILMMMNSALLTKLGAAPFHFWFPEVIEGLSWTNSLILMTWQKIAPMSLIMNTSPNWLFMSAIIVISMTIGGVMGLNQTSLRKLLAFSSINHIGWMLAAMMISMSSWTWYFITYSLLTLNLTLIMKWNKSFLMKQVMNSQMSNKLIKLSFMINFLSLGGLPPFIGFMPKWLVIKSLMSNEQITLSIIMVTLTLISLYIYLRILFSSLILINSESKINFKSTMYWTLSSINVTTSILIVISTLILTSFKDLS